MATKKEIIRQLLKGVSWNDAARLLGCSKATVAKCAAKVREEGIDAERLEATTDAEVSALFEDRRAKRAEEYPEPDHAQICDQLARVPKMTLALQWGALLRLQPRREEALPVLPVLQEGRRLTPGPTTSPHASPTSPAG